MALNQRQRITVIIALAVVAVMLIFPPAYYLYAPYQIRYTFFFAVKSLREEVLIFQILIVAVVTLILVLWFGRK